MMMKLYLISGGFVCLVVSSLFLASEASGQQQQIRPPQTLQSAPPQTLQSAPPQTLQSAPPQTPQPSSPQLQQPPQQQIPQQPPQQQPFSQPQQQQQLVQLYNPNQVVACLNNVLAQSIIKAGTLNNNTRVTAGVNSTFMDNATKTLDNCIVPTTTTTR